MQPTITARQAAEQVGDYVRQVLAALPPDTTAVLAYRDTYSCDNPSDGGPLGRVIASVEYQLTGLPADTYPDRFDTLQRWWLDHRFDILADARPHGHYLWVENDRDGFRMALQANDRDELFLMCSSPCIWPYGSPEPPAAVRPAPTTPRASATPRATDPADH